MSTPEPMPSAPAKGGHGSRYLFLFLVLVSIVICWRLQDSRIGRAWMAIREDEIAAKAMGLNTRNLKLLAFGMGATFGGISGVLFASFQRFVSPESFSLMESVMVVAMVVLGGIGHIPGVILGALLLAGLVHGEKVSLQADHAKLNRFVDAAYARHCTRNPLRRGQRLGEHYQLLDNGQASR